MNVEQTKKDPTGTYLRDLYVPVLAKRKCDLTNSVKISFFHNKPKGKMFIIFHRCTRDLPRDLEHVRIDECGKVELGAFKYHNNVEADRMIDRSIREIVTERGVIWQSFKRFMTQHDLQPGLSEIVSA